MIFFNKYNVRLLSKDTEYLAYYQLRHQVFCERYGWREVNKLGLERDEYDDHADFVVGVFLKETNELVGGHRCIRWPKKFMFYREYEGVFSDISIVEGEQVSEFSRWTIRGDYLRELLSRKNWKSSVSLNLFKMGYLECQNQAIEFVYTHSYPAIFQALNRRGFPFHEVATRELSNGDKVQLAVMSWDEFKKENAQNQPDLLDWFNEGFPDSSVFVNDDAHAKLKTKTDP